ncbi:glycine cleavage system aminomethyltransferase GcvT [Mangrovibacillus cuniculi]|uniref:Aminomethyltransferase n=1 Tax=Mangrovibacillus cuniculi TaxID=2593652 RepID=A0A7S8HFT3_9BACI|nr:glycine cleavage system aminomethyltransferase GcvT [Mangrovibacillus cuniculi]QPC46851.1 glycine cleavage system aminomethyltransferase GcvT [Mangrovibacillus cuniculi]
MTALRTPLYDVYKEFGAKTIDFGGWELPVQFSSILEEHEAVRTTAGLFDVSHMGEIQVKGSGAFSYLQKLLTNDMSKLEDGKALYTAMCYENGGTVDDLLVYQLEANDYLLVVNAANIEKDYEWMVRHATEDVEVVNLSHQYAQIALQGPAANNILSSLVDFDVESIRFFRFENELMIAGIPTLVSRTGYTGEDGFELYCPADQGAELFRSVMKAGEPFGIKACGLGARDTLRFEATLALYGQELSSEITPLEAGIGFAVSFKKSDDFIGRNVLEKQKAEGLERKLVGIEMMDKAIPRHGYKVLVNDQEIGHVTTGTQSPTLKKNIGLALLNIDFTEKGTEVEVEIRGKRKKGQVIPTPFYKRTK